MAPTNSTAASTARNFFLAVFLLVTSTTRMVCAEISDTTEAIPTQQVVLDEHEKNDLLSDTTIEQIHVITRHGSRTMLSRDPDTLAEEGVATLTPLGQLQLYNLGAWLRNTYQDRLGVHIYAGKHKSLDFYNPNLHRFESTNFDRTLSSANALAMGLFPESTRASGSHNYDPIDPQYDEVLYESALPTPPAIPVYTTGQDKNDVTLRAHSNCPRFHERLADLYKSNDWISLETMNEDLLVKLAIYFPELAVNGMVPLKDARNAYDDMHVARTECFLDQNLLENCEAFVAGESVITAVGMFSDDEFQQLESITEHVEFLKYGSGMNFDPFHGKDTAGALLGSNLLWKILNRSKGDGDFFMYSTDEPTLFGLLSTLQASSDFHGDTGGEKYFDYGSALIVEIHKSVEMGKYYFVLKYKAYETAEAVSVILRESTTGVQCGSDHPELQNLDKFNWCMLDEIVNWAQITTYSSEEAWCSACSNNEADVCLRKTGDGRGTPTLDAWIAGADEMGYAGAPGANFIICSLFFGGFSAGILFMGAMWWFGGSCRNKTTKSGKTLSVDTSDASDDSKMDTVDTVIEGIFVQAGVAEKLNDKEIC